MLGVSISYCSSITVFKQIGDHFLDLLVKAAQDGKYVRFIGDNLDFVTGMSHEIREKHKHMVHMFASCALVSKHLFKHMPSTPQVSLTDLTLEHILLSPREYLVIRDSCIKLVVDVASLFLPQLQFMKKSVSWSPGMMLSI